MAGVDPAHLIVTTSLRELLVDSGSSHGRLTQADWPGRIVLAVYLEESDTRGRFAKLFASLESG